MNRNQKGLDFLTCIPVFIKNCLLYDGKGQDQVIIDETKSLSEQLV